jgi:hypothetical protein
MGTGILVGVRKYEENLWCSCISADDHRHHEQMGTIDVPSHAVTSMMCVLALCRARPELFRRPPQFWAWKT